MVGRLSFFVNAGIRFVEEICKMKAFVRLWDRLTRERYGVEDPKQRRFRYGVQVNSLGLTAQQPENNVQRIVLEMLAVVLSKEARARSVQLPAWNEALGLPRPWDQQWSLRIQQVMAYETDLLEYDADLFAGSTVIEEKVDQLMRDAVAELARIEALGGAENAIDVMKQALVASHSERQRRIEAGELPVVGVNVFTEHEPSPLVASGLDSILTVDPAAERRQVERLRAFRGQRSAAAVAGALRASGRRRPPRRPTSCRRRSRRRRRESRPESGRVRCAAFSASSAPRQACRGRARRRAATRWRHCGSEPRRWRRASGIPCGCWSANPAWTVIRTGPSRWRCAPRMRDSR